ncbi:hypothetical protein L202_01401 [Cryptococcus amylolentus CBS 6039]|uniref:6-phosphogluconolactonase n=1 Tax=Cryptococcus amylolentus CBS 6039 TaxID=1295533 RepID=A0A1E3I5V7_9TREE|nr:hypothetical protein L202_01401 [Cryptococcus amylolentus CBS 6039]ODN83216.1 hypothetical protein L202_01401 [Cryptococcus amylolentus CBS 6039]
MSSYTLLVSGYRKYFSLVAFDPSTRGIKVLSDSPAPENASWVEPAAKKSTDGSRIVYSLSEAEKGKALSLVVKDDKVTVTSERDTLGGSCHVHIMKDGSGIVVANYLGGSLIYFPTEQDGTLSATSASPLLKFDLVYTEQGQTPPNPERQDASHCHQVIEGDDGILYVPDLGNDRVWVVWRGGESGLSVKGWCQAPAGTGPRHATISKDGKHLYVLTELANTLLTFPLTDPTYPIIPHPDSGISIAPPSVPEQYIKYLNAAELLAHPSLPVLYASNRLELDIGKASSGKFESKEKGDAVAIATLSSDGTLEAVQHVRTGVDNIRAMQLSLDGKFVALAGQNGGGVEVYNVGQDGKTWELMAKNEAITKVTDLAWL